MHASATLATIHKLKLYSQTSPTQHIHSINTVAFSLQPNRPTSNHPEKSYSPRPLQPHSSSQHLHQANIPTTMRHQLLYQLILAPLIATSLLLNHTSLEEPGIHLNITEDKVKWPKVKGGGGGASAASASRANMGMVVGVAILGLVL